MSQMIVGVKPERTNKPLKNRERHSERQCVWHRERWQEGSLSKFRSYLLCSCTYIKTNSGLHEIDSSACHLSLYFFICRVKIRVSECVFVFPPSLHGLAAWLIISLSCFTYRHTSARLGLSRTEARLNGFGNCLLIHLNRIQKSLCV